MIVAVLCCQNRHPVHCIIEHHKRSDLCDFGRVVQVQWTNDMISEKAVLGKRIDNPKEPCLLKNDSNEAMADCLVC